MRSTYRRNASGDYLCKEWEVAIMLAEQRPKLAMDAEILEGYTFDDIDKESLRGCYGFAIMRFARLML